MLRDGNSGLIIIVIDHLTAPLTPIFSALVGDTNLSVPVRNAPIPVSVKPAIPEMSRPIVVTPRLEVGCSNQER